MLQQTSTVVAPTLQISYHIFYDQITLNGEYEIKKILTVPPLVSPALWLPGSSPLEPTDGFQSSLSPLWQGGVRLGLQAVDRASPSIAIYWVAAPAGGQETWPKGFSERLTEGLSPAETVADSGWPKPVSDRGRRLQASHILKTHVIMITGKKKMFRKWSIWYTERDK